MEKELKYKSETGKFIEEFVKLVVSEKNVKKGNDKVMHSALLYEKFRTAIEYQEDHLIFKNAVSRIIYRQYTLSLSRTVESLFDDLMSELSWADYINLEALTETDVLKIKSVIGRYLVLLDLVQTKSSAKYDAQKTVIGWLACEIDEILFPRARQELLIDFTYFCLKDNLSINPEKILTKEQEIQLKLSILTLIFKPDYAYAEFWLAKILFPDLENFSAEYAKEIGRHFDNIISQTERVFYNKFSKNYLSYAKRYIAPFILIKELPNYQRDLTSIEENPAKLKNLLMLVYDNLLSKTRDKVWRGTIRALIFIFLTKISLAFIIEMPFDQYFNGSIAYFPLMVNIITPPCLMFFAGILVKNPPAKNRDVVANAITNLLEYEKIDSKPFRIGLKRYSSLEKIFNFLYLVFNLGIVTGVIALLIKIGFNFIGILLFFIFISAVSFFAFRIRNIALELMMQPLKENLVVSSIEFVFLPFILIGKFLSAKLTKSNPFTITLDFLIEAPLKSLMKISNSWVRFIKQKKDDIDI